MKTFTDMHESILDNVDAQIKAGNKVINKIKDIQQVRDSLIHISALWHSIKPRKDFNDEWGNTPEFGDIVICKSSVNFVLGVVIDIDSKKNGCKIAACVINGLHDMATEEDPFGDTISNWVKMKDLVILAKKKDALKLLKILVKLT
jgi:hypothetical protein